MQSRLKNAKINIYVGIFTQFIILILSFISRRLFVQYLSVEYLGINGLYTNILSVLSLAELGLGSVASYSLYKPVAEDNKPAILGLLKYFKKLYRIIALVITILVIALTPFLKYIITSDLSQAELIIYYLLFLASTVSTYFAAHNMALLFAYQENRIPKLVKLITAVTQQIIHFIILLVFPNYMVYVSSTIICAIFSNYFLSVITTQKHSYLKTKEIPDYDIPKEYIKSNIKSSSIYKLSLVAINSTDNILISVLVSTMAVGLYSNYVAITSAVQSFISIITIALINGIGNLYAENDKKQTLAAFKSLVLIYHFIACMGAIFFYHILNPFISIWLGKEYLMSNNVIIAICLNFFVLNATTPIWSFREATGQFTATKYIILITAILNILLSVIMGYYWGVTGILIATVVAQALTIIWYEPKILFKNVFEDRQSIYWKKQIKYFICSLICVALCGIVSKFMLNGIIGMALFGIETLIICSIIFYLATCRDEEILKIKLLLSKKNR